MKPILKTIACTPLLWMLLFSACKKEPNKNNKRRVPNAGHQHLSTSGLSMTGGFVAVIAVGAKIFWARGLHRQPNQAFTNLVEIRDAIPLTPLSLVYSGRMPLLNIFFYEPFFINQLFTTI